MYAHDYDFRFGQYLSAKAREDEPPQADDQLVVEMRAGNLNSLKPPVLVSVFDVKKMRAIVGEYTPIRDGRTYADLTATNCWRLKPGVLTMRI